LNDGQDVIHKIQKALKVQEISRSFMEICHRRLCQISGNEGNILKVMPLFMKKTHVIKGVLAEKSNQEMLSSLGIVVPWSGYA
jgi:hypothetical protein